MKSVHSSEMLCGARLRGAAGVPSVHEQRTDPVPATPQPRDKSVAHLRVPWEDTLPQASAPPLDRLGPIDAHRVFLGLFEGYVARYPLSTLSPTPPPKIDADPRLRVLEGFLGCYRTLAGASHPWSPTRVPASDTEALWAALHVVPRDVSICLSIAEAWARHLGSSEGADQIVAQGAGVPSTLNDAHPPRKRSRAAAYPGACDGHAYHGMEQDLERATASTAMQADLADSHAGTRYLVLPILAFQIFATFQQRLIDGALAKEAAASGSSDTGMPHERHRHTTYKREVGTTDRLLVAATCVLIGWKLIQREATAEALFVGPELPEPRNATSTAHTKCDGTDPRNASSSSSNRQTGSCHILDRLRHVACRTGTRTALRHVAALERRVYKELGHHVERLPWWWEVGWHTVHATRSAAAPTHGQWQATMQRFLSLALQLLTHVTHGTLDILASPQPVEAGMGSADATNAADEKVLADALGLPAWTTYDGVDTDMKGGVKNRAEFLMRYHPFFGVALAVEAGTPLETAEQKVLGLLSFPEAEALVMRERTLSKPLSLPIQRALFSVCLHEELLCVLRDVHVLTRCAAHDTT